MKFHRFIGIWWIFRITYFKNVRLIEHPSAAPTPSSRKIFCACSKFGALNNERVMKWRAEKNNTKEIVQTNEQNSLSIVVVVTLFACFHNENRKRRTI